MKRKQWGFLILAAVLFVAAGLAGTLFLLQGTNLAAEKIKEALGFSQEGGLKEELAEEDVRKTPDESQDPLEAWLSSVGEGRDRYGAAADGDLTGTGPGDNGAAGSGSRRSGTAAGWKRKITLDTGRKPSEDDTAPEPPKELATPSEAEKNPPVVWIVSDLHYQSMAATDFGKAFKQLVADSDGKLIRYLPELTDALIYEAEQEKPDALLLTGDITMNGERMNHEELAGKLKKLETSGVQVLVIPGNHDINNYRGKTYFGEEPAEAESVSFQEFTEIYGDFGWDQALFRDSASFSYVYALDEKNWLLLLDTAIYEPLNIVDGAVRQETLSWMEQVLEQAHTQGVRVITAGHHNLLQQSSMFTEMVVMLNAKEVRECFERYDMPLYISGHLHVQRISRYRTEPGAKDGIQELVSDAVSIPPCQYGILSWQRDGTLDYETRSCQVSSWAAKTGQTDENLLNFEAYESSYVQEIIAAQIEGSLSGPPDNQIRDMAKLYADIYAAYCSGRDLKQEKYRTTSAYHSWERYLPESETFHEIKSMLKDSMQENNSFVLPGAAEEGLTP